MTPDDLHKALLRAAEPCSKSSTLKGRIANGNFYLAVEGRPTVAVYRAGDTRARTINVEKEKAGDNPGHLPSAVHTAEFTLPWRDGNREA